MNEIPTKPSKTEELVSFTCFSCGKEKHFPRPIRDIVQRHLEIDSFIVCHACAGGNRKTLKKEDVLKLKEKYGK